AAAPPNVEYLYGLSTADRYEYMVSRMALLTEGLVAHPPNGFQVTFTEREITETKNRILDLLNIRYLITTKINESQSLLRAQPDRFREVWSDGTASVFENLASLPRAFLVPQMNAELIPSEEAQLARLRESSFDPEQQVILPTRAEKSDSEEVSGLPGVVKYT